MPLNQEQLNALPILEWLCDPDRRVTGRSIALAVAAIRTAARRPRIDVRVFDHATTQEARRTTFTYVRRMISRDPRLSPYAVFHDSEMRVRLDLRMPIFDWLPSEAVLGMTEMDVPMDRERERQEQRMREMGDEQFNAENSITPEMAERLDRGLRDLAATRAWAQQTVNPPRSRPIPAQPGYIPPATMPRRDPTVEEALVQLIPDEALKPDEKPKRKPPGPKSVWDRLLKDNGED